MTVTQKKMTIDEVMSINEAVLKESSKTLVLSEEKFAVPIPDKTVDAKPEDATETTSGGILTLKEPIATKVVCFSRLLKCLRSLYGKQCGPRSDC